MVKHRGKRYGSCKIKYFKFFFFYYRNYRKAFLQKEGRRAAEEYILGVLNRIFLIGTCFFFSQYFANVNNY